MFKPNFTALSAWSLFIGSIWLVLRDLLRRVGGQNGSLFLNTEKKKIQALLAAKSHALQLREKIESGWLPEQSEWEKISDWPWPWGALAYSSIQELRSQGSKILPTLRRFENRMEEELELIREVQIRTAQAKGQAIVCGAMIPLLALVLPFLLPALKKELFWWGIASCISAGIAFGGAIWILKMADKARWGGLAPERRCWVAALEASGESFISAVLGGSPSDLGWEALWRTLHQSAPELAEYWGASFWMPKDFEAEEKARYSKNLQRSGDISAGIFLAASQVIRTALQASLMEGRPALERFETVFRGIRNDLRTRVDHALALLPTQALKPLFICVAPAVFLLFGVALWLSVLGPELGRGVQF